MARPFHCFYYCATLVQRLWEPSKVWFSNVCGNSGQGVKPQPHFCFRINGGKSLINTWTRGLQNLLWPVSSVCCPRLSLIRSLALFNNFPDQCLSMQPTFASMLSPVWSPLHTHVQQRVHQGIPGCVWNAVQDQAGGEPYANCLQLLINPLN